MNEKQHAVGNSSICDTWSKSFVVNRLQSEKIKYNNVTSNQCKQKAAFFPWDWSAHTYTHWHSPTCSEPLYLELIVTVAMVIMPCKIADWDLAFWLNAGKTRGRASLQDGTIISTQSTALTLKQPALKLQHPRLVSAYVCVCVLCVGMQGWFMTPVGDSP